MAAQSAIAAARSAALAASSELMAELGLSSAKRSLEGAAAATTAAEKARRKTARKARASAAAEASSQPRRRSLRQLGLQTDGESTVDKDSVSFFTPYQAPARPQRTPGDVSMATAALPQEQEEHQDMLAACKDFLQAPPKVSKRKAIQWSKLSLRHSHHMEKGVGARIYSIAMHPGPQPVAVIGDKEGMLGLWRPSSGALPVPPGVDPDEVEDRGSLLQFRAHSRPINAVKALRDVVMTCSYEGNVRLLDLETGTFKESYVHFPDDEGPGASGLAYADISQDARLLVASSFDGELVVADTRALTARDSILSKNRSSSECVVVDAHSKKASSVSLHPGGMHVATASHDNTVSIWDLRKLGRGKKGSGAAPVSTLSHGGGVTSAFFSECGGRLVSTCNDDFLRVWHDAPTCSGKPKVSIKHNNHTGRWLSNFRCVFDPSDSIRVVIGAMQIRHLQAFDSNTGEQVCSVGDELLTAVPTLNAVHPHVPVVVSGTGSGRVHMWSSADWD